MVYEDFINELKVLSDEAKGLLNAEKYDENPVFRKWRLKLTDLIIRINKDGYEVVCNIDKRSFGSIFPAKKTKLEHFNMELQDTINEAEIIIDRFHKNGTPAKENKVSKNKAELEWPEKITLNWLYKHAPISLWVKLGTILISVFLFGLTVGQSAFFNETIVYSSSDSKDIILPPKQHRLLSIIAKYQKSTGRDYVTMRDDGYSDEINFKEQLYGTDKPSSPVHVQAVEFPKLIEDIPEIYLRHYSTYPRGFKVAVTKEGLRYLAKHD